MRCPGQLSIGILAARKLAAVALPSTDNSRVPSRHLWARQLLASACSPNSIVGHIEARRGGSAFPLQMVDAYQRAVLFASTNGNRRARLHLSPENTTSACMPRMSAIVIQCSITARLF
jgi:hypothetical protein